MDDHDQTRPPWFALASRAIQHAVREDHGAAADAIEQLDREFGTQGLASAMQSWADTALSFMPPPLPGQPIALSFTDADTGESSDADGVTPATAWAGRVLAARAADGPLTYFALLETTRDAREWSVRIGSFLSLCALNIRAAIVAGARPQPWPQISTSPR